MTALDTTFVDGHTFHTPADPTPPEPIVHEEPPADIDACSHCDGTGVMVVGRDEADRPLDEPCTWCDATGNRRGWAAMSAFCPEGCPDADACVVGHPCALHPTESDAT